MYRTALRTVSRPALRSMRPASKRFVSSSPSPADRPRSWKSSALRWGLAGGALYYYTTSSVFADEAAAPQTIPAPPQFADSDLPTVDSVLEEKRKQIQAQIEKDAPPTTPSTTETAKNAPKDTSAESVVADVEGAALSEEEAGQGQQAAFNPETGEINWDCPCLGGMAHGPCGEEFKTAFSCFVYSEEEPKGMDCIDKFQGMQTCFKQYPEIYGAELTDEGDDADLDAPADAPPANEAAPVQAERKEEPVAEAPASPVKEEKFELEAETKVEAPAAVEPEKKKETLTAAPKVIEPPAPAWEDARSANEKDASKQ